MLENITQSRWGIIRTDQNLEKVPTLNIEVSEPSSKSVDTRIESVFSTSTKIATDEKVSALD